MNCSDTGTNNRWNRAHLKSVTCGFVLMPCQCNRFSEHLFSNMQIRMSDFIEIALCSKANRTFFSSTSNMLFVFVNGFSFDCMNFKESSVATHLDVDTNLHVMIKSLTIAWAVAIRPWTFPSMLCCTDFYHDLHGIIRFTDFKASFLGLNRFRIQQYHSASVSRRRWATKHYIWKNFS